MSYFGYKGESCMVFDDGYCIITLRSVFYTANAALDTLPSLLYYELLVNGIVHCTGNYNGIRIFV